MIKVEIVAVKRNKHNGTATNLHQIVHEKKNLVFFPFRGQSFTIIF